MCLLWVVAGAIATPAAYAVVVVSLIIFWQRGMYEQCFLGFFFILLLSDSLVESLDFAKSLKNIYIVMMGAMFIANPRNFMPFTRKIFYIFIPFFLFALFCLLFSETPVSIQKTVSFILLFLLVPNFVVNAYRQNGDSFLRSLVFFPLLLLIVGLAMIFISRDIAFLDSQRYRGLLGSPNGTGLLCVLLLIVFSIVSSLRENIFSRNEKLLIYGVIFLSAFLTESRNSVLAVVLFLVYARFYKISPFLGFIAFLVTILLQMVLEDNIADIISQLGLSKYFRVNTLSEGSGRYIAWNFAWEEIGRNTFFVGKGFGYDEYYMRPHYAVLSRLGHQGGVHNSFLSFWLDVGLIGLLLYLRSFILMFIKSAARNKLAFPAMFAVSFTALFESWLVGSLNPFTIILLTAVTLMIEPVFTEEAEPEEVAEGGEEENIQLA